jgi:hypothetical protein
VPSAETRWRETAARLVSACSELGTTELIEQFGKRFCGEKLEVEPKKERTAC